VQQPAVRTPLQRLLGDQAGRQVKMKITTLQNTLALPG
jgi:hypothetical protein